MFQTFIISRTYTFDQRMTSSGDSVKPMLNLIHFTGIFLAVCIAAIGQVPAWTHVAQHALADQAISGSSAAHRNTESCSGSASTCSCSHGTKEKDNSDTPLPHDHSDCPICQSIYTHVATIEMPPTSLEWRPLLLENVRPTDTELETGVDLLIPESRGPPNS